MLYRGRRQITTCFISVIRQLFRKHPIFPYSPSKLESKIYIDEAYPTGARRFPCVVCTDISEGQYFQTSFNRNMLDNIYDDNGIETGATHGFILTPTVGIEVSTLTKQDTEMVTDYICSYMLYDGINRFADAGITILTSTGSAIQAEDYGKETIYSVKLIFNIQAEWLLTVNFDADAISDISIPTITVVSGDNIHEDREPL